MPVKIYSDEISNLLYAMENLCPYRQIISERSRLFHHNFDYCKFNNSTKKYMSNEILKLLHGMKNLHSDENEVL